MTAFSLRSQKGFGLAEILISFGIMGVIMMSVISIMTSQSKDARALTEKLAASDLGRTISSTLISQSSCSLIFTRPGNIAPGSSLTFDTSAVAYPVIIQFLSIPQSPTTDILKLNTPDGSGLQASGLSATLKIKPTNSIYMAVLTESTGNLIVNFDQSTLVRPIKDLIFPVSFTTTKIGSIVTITGCVGTGGGGGGFGAYELKALNTNHTATTDGFVVALANTTNTSLINRTTYLVGATDGKVVGYAGTTDLMGPNPSTGPQSMMFPVAKNKIWRVDLGSGNPDNATVYWVPVGTP